MRFGLMLDPSGDPAGVPAQARTAEQLGFDFLACGEHVFFHGPVSNAFVALSAAAAVTDRIGLLSALTLLPLYPAALVAKMAASLDLLSGGRFTLGVGVGGEYPPEFAACGVPVRQRGARSDESLTVLRALLSGKTLSLNGQFAQLDALKLEPPPVQLPLPIWVGGRRTAALRRAGRFADVWLPYLITPEMLARGLESVRGFAREYDRPAAAVSAAVFLWGSVSASPGAAREQAIAAVSRTYRQDFAPIADKYLLAGDPAAVAVRLHAYASAGASAIVFAPACEPAQRAGVIELFAQDVMPGFSGGS
jgi:probable F420-dependent oxidoreductase